MAMTLKFKNENIASVADECELVIEPKIPSVTASEISFFIDGIIDKLADVVRCGISSKNTADEILDKMNEWKTYK